jgi:hypothetical protein
MSGSLKDELLRLGLAKPKADEPKQRRHDERARRRDERAPRRPDAPAASGRDSARRARDARPDTASQPPARTPEGSRPAAAPDVSDERAKNREREARMARLRERIEALKLDDPQGEIKQYYSTGKKIKRIYVTEAQAAALLRGEIVIVVAQARAGSSRAPCCLSCARSIRSCASSIRGRQARRRTTACRMICGGEGRARERLLRRADDLGW